MERPWLLDLFAGAGGAGEGYRRAGFHVVAVDIDPKPLRHNPHEWYVVDALAVLDTLLAGETWQGYRLHDFAAIHASPPCQAFTVLNARWQKVYPNHIPATRERLQAWGGVWVMENVPGAPFDYAMQLCGSMFGLRVQRHRWFESSHLLYPPGPCRHRKGTLIYGDRTYTREREYADALGCGWMPARAARQAIPPAYTHWIGEQLMAVIAAGVAA